MRYLIIAMSMLLYAAIPAQAQISVGIQSHGVSIGFNVSAYPRLVAIPGYPVYYDPRASTNYFFYDGLYWVYENDNWYSSAWYDGPWDLVDPAYVPLFVLRVPVRYYRHRPAYFSGWSLEYAPRWGEHWGHDWEQHRSGWDHWDRHSVPHAAPLPSYQAQYSGNRYPRAAEQQYSIQSKSYRYQPREAVTKQYFQQHAAPGGAQQTPQQAPSQQQSRTQGQQQQRQQHAKDQAQQQSHAQQQQQQQHARDQAQPQQPRTQQPQPQQRTRDQAQQQPHAPPQQQQQRAKDQAPQQSHAPQQQQQQQRARDQAQPQQQRAEQRPPAQQQQQKQQHVQQQAPAAKGPSNQQQQRPQPAPKGKSSQQKPPQQDKGKDDKKDGGGN